MDEILTIIKAAEPIGIAILIWRSIVADRERAVLMKQAQETQQWMRGLFAELLPKKPS